MHVASALNVSWKYDVGDRWHETNRLFISKDRKVMYGSIVFYIITYYNIFFVAYQDKIFKPARYVG